MQGTICIKNCGINCFEFFFNSFFPSQLVFLRSYIVTYCIAYVFLVFFFTFLGDPQAIDQDGGESGQVVYRLAEDSDDM